jgi:hypothetical protein
MRLVSIFLALLLVACSQDEKLSFKVINEEEEALGVISLADGVEIPRISSGYTLWIPAADSIEGLVVFMHARRDTSATEPVIELAARHKLAVLYVTTDNRLEFLFEEENMLEIEGYIQEVISSYVIPAGNILYCGMSLAGTRALRMAMFAQGPSSRYRIIPKAIAVCDAPLDMVRFFREARKAAILDFHPIAANEGFWVANHLYDQFGGAPGDTMKAYVAYSPFVYEARDGGNAGYFKDIAIRTYTEPDVHWWMETRRKDYYSMNAMDMAGLVNQLNILGNTRAELITTAGKGFHPDGERHPHSWSIVDEEELLNWFAGL